MFSFMVTLAGGGFQAGVISLLLYLYGIVFTLKNKIGSAKSIRRSDWRLSLTGVGVYTWLKAAIIRLQLYRLC